MKRLQAARAKKPIFLFSSECGPVVVPKTVMGSEYWVSIFPANQLTRQYGVRTKKKVVEAYTVLVGKLRGKRLLKIQLIIKKLDVSIWSGCSWLMMGSSSELLRKRQRNVKSIKVTGSHW